MKAYVITTSAAFALLAVLHIAKLIAEGPSLLKDPFYVLTTLLALALTGWALSLIRRPPAA